MTKLMTPGTLDPTFGSDGATQLLEGVKAFAVLPNHKLIIVSKETVAAPLKLARLTESGEPDKSFGDNGVVEFAPGTLPHFFSNRICALPNGKFLITAIHQKIDPDNLYVLRLLEDGTLDTSFGDGGWIILKASELTGAGQGVKFLNGEGEPAISDVTYYDSPLITVSETENRIYVSAGIFTDAGPAGVLFCLHANGLQDESFNGGYVLIRDPDFTKSIRLGALAVHGKGVLVAGANFSRGEPGVGRAYVTRYDQSGQMDRTFGADGTTFIPDGNDGRKAHASSLAVRHDGLIVVSGFSVTGGAGEGLMSVLNPSGSLNEIFNRGEPVHADFLGDLQFWDCALQREKTIVVMGRGNGGHLVVARYRLDGFLDETFANAGWADSGLWTSVYYQGTLTPDDKIVMVGEGTLSFALRYLG